DGLQSHGLDGGRHPETQVDDAQIVAQQHGSGQDDHDRAGVDHRLAHDTQNFHQAHPAVEQLADHQRIHHRYDGGLGRRINAAVDAAQDHDGQEQAGRRLRQRGQSFGHAGARATRVILDARDQHGTYQQRQHRQQAGNQRRGKQRHHRLIGNEAVQDQRDARRNQNTQRSAGRRHAHGVAAVIAGGHHGGDGDRPDGQRSGHAGAGYRRKNRAGQNGGHSQAAPQMPHPYPRELDQRVGYAARGHQIGRDDEKGHGHQRKGRQAVVDDLGRSQQGQVGDVEAQQRAQAQRKVDRRADGQQRDQQQDGQVVNHGKPPAAGGARYGPRARSTQWRIPPARPRALSIAETAARSATLH